MRALHFFPIILTFSLLLFSCNKEGHNTDDTKEVVQKIPDGSFTGSFTVQYRSLTKTGSITLELRNGNYTCSGNYDRIPAGGSGAFSIETGKIRFIDKNVWTADFDWNLILNGQYNYTFDGNKLTISAEKNNVGQYVYNLQKN